MLKNYKFSTGISDKKGYSVCFIGPTSVGKSTLYNNLFNLKLQTGLGSCTKTATLIQAPNTKWYYYDAPGINKDFNFYRAQHLNFFNDLDEIFILFDRDVDDVHLIIKVFKAM